MAPRILDLGTGWRWSVSRPGRFTPRERAPGAHWIGDWVGPRASSDAVMKRKVPNPRRDSNPRTLRQHKIMETLRIKHYALIMCTELVS
jgi:hypothetical protein